MALAYPGRFGHNAIVMKTLRATLLLLCAIPAGWGATIAAAADVGAPAPALALPTAGGETVTLEGLRGKVVYVDFWASWCGPCRKSFPWMAEMQRKYGPSGFTVVAVNVDKKRPDAERFLQATPAQFTVVYDPAGTTPSTWNVKAMPSSFVVDARGNVALVESGFRDENVPELEGKIKALVGAK
jgi:cytochrome c biogenesis protein CcmG, thiol:disulfide interchange protein DsbE